MIQSTTLNFKNLTRLLLFSRIPDPTFFHPISRIRDPYFSIQDPRSASKN